MSKNLVVGQDILIQIVSDDILYPFITEFDECDINSLRKDGIYKSIGKRVIKTHSQSSGYKISLTRAKRDNYLDSLIQFVDQFTERGLEPPTFSVIVQTNFTYPESELNPFNDSSLQVVSRKQNQYQDDFKLKQRSRALEFGINLTKTVSNQLINLARTNEQTKIIAQSFDNAVGLINAGSNAYNVAKSIISKYNDLFGDNIKMEDLPEYKTLINQIKIYNESIGELFKTVYVYKGCSLSNDSTSHRVREYSVDKLSMIASTKVNLSPINSTDDNEFKKYFNNYLQERLLKQGEVAFGKEYFIDNQILNDRFIKNYKIRIES